MTPFCLLIRSCSKGVLACTDYVRMYIFSRASGILLRFDTWQASTACLLMISALCGPLPSLQYTGWCVVVEVMTALLVNLCCVVYLLRIIYQSVHIHILGQQQLDSLSPSTCLDGVCVSLPCGRRQVVLFRGMGVYFFNCSNRFLSLFDSNQLDCD